MTYAQLFFNRKKLSLCKELTSYIDSFFSDAFVKNMWISSNFLHKTRAKLVTMS